MLWLLIGESAGFSAVIAEGVFDSFADVIFISTDAVGAECVAERRRVFFPVSPDSRYVFDLVLRHGGVEVGDARIEVDEAI